MFEKRIFIPCTDHDIPTVITYPDGDGPFPCMLLLHGYMAYKEGDGYLFTKTAIECAKQGIASARIDFCSMGENRYSRENYGLKVMLEETRTAFEALQKEEKIISDRIGILGHSLGGRITFLSASLPSKCLVTFNGGINVKEDMSKKQPASFKVKEEKDYTLVHTSDGRVELLFPRFHEEMKQYRNEDIYQYKNPVLVCVGDKDPTLDPNISYDFVKNCGMDNVELIVISDANHTFNAKTKDYTKVYELLDKVVPWLKKHLQEE